MHSKTEMRLLGTLLRQHALNRDGFSIFETADLSGSRKDDVRAIIAAMIEASEIECVSGQSVRGATDEKELYKLTDLGRHNLMEEIVARLKNVTLDEALYEQEIRANMERAEQTVLDASNANEQDRIDLLMDARQEFAFCERCIEGASSMQLGSLAYWTVKLSDLQSKLEDLVQAEDAPSPPSISPQRM